MYKHSNKFLNFFKPTLLSLYEKNKKIPTILTIKLLFSQLLKIYSIYFSCIQQPNPNSLLTEIKLIFIRRYKTFFLYNLSTKIITSYNISSERHYFFAQITKPISKSLTRHPEREVNVLRDMT